MPKEKSTLPAPLPAVMSTEHPNVPLLVRIPGGSFEMGSNDEKTNERSVRKVHVSSFELGKYEVTFDEWDACFKAGGCSHRPEDNGLGRGKRPVINVSWDDVQEYLKWLSHKSGREYRLPSEVEWVYAMQRGTTEPLHTVDEAAQGEHIKERLLVGGLPLNPLGLHDVHGSI